MPIKEGYKPVKQASRKIEGKLKEEIERLV